MALAPPSGLVASPFSSLLSPPVITTNSLPNATIGQAYAATISATGGLQPYTWRLNEGILPPGLALASSGAQTALISGMPTTTGNFSFSIMCTDALQQQTMIAFQMG